MDAHEPARFVRVANTRVTRRRRPVAALVFANQRSAGGGEDIRRRARAFGQRSRMFLCEHVLVELTHKPEPRRSFAFGEARPAALRGMFARRSISSEERRPLEDHGFGARLVSECDSIPASRATVFTSACVPSRPSPAA